VVERLHAAGTPHLPPSRHRRLAVRDPEGVFIEVIEGDTRPRGSPNVARPEVPSVVRFVRASVPDLELATRFFAGILGFVPAPEPRLHQAQDEALWGLAGARLNTVELVAGDCVLELAQYEEPKGRPWPAGYRISDLGLLNVAFGSRRRQDYEAVVARVRASGYPMHQEMTTDFASVVYVEDGQGFSVELLHLEPGKESLAGFEPRTWARAAK
jgi:catechol 2,3-dioxygenase-like lactoylglutathione lyase family enzyme